MSTSINRSRIEVLDATGEGTSEKASGRLSLARGTEGERSEKAPDTVTSSGVAGKSMRVTSPDTARPDEKASMVKARGNETMLHPKKIERAGSFALHLNKCL